MANAKNTLAEYNKIRSELKTKTDRLTEEKRAKAGEVVTALSYKTSEEAEAEGKLARKTLTRARKEENKSILEEYKSLAKSKRNDEKQFQILLEDARERLNSDLNEDDFRELLIGKTETSLENLPESVQSKKVESMVSYAKENDKDHAEKIEGWAKTREELRAKGIINDSSKGVDIKGIGLLASTQEHNKVLKENFGNKVRSPFINWKNHAGDESQIDTVEKADLDKKMKKGGLEGDYKLASKEFITDTIFPWITQHFEGVEDQDDRLYILQLINPDLFTRLWLDNVDSSGHSRQAVALGRIVIDRHFDDFSDFDTGGLFLVGKA